MQGNTTHRPAPDSKNQWLLAVMVVAATAVIVLSLLGLARMTGLIPRLGNDQQEAETTREKPRSAPKEREGGTPDGQRPGPATVPGTRSPRRFAQCMRCDGPEQLRVTARDRTRSPGGSVIAFTDLVP